jgi:hypothetical protein
MDGTEAGEGETRCLPPNLLLRRLGTRPMSYVRSHAESATAPGAKRSRPPYPPHKLSTFVNFCKPPF